MIEEITYWPTIVLPEGSEAEDVRSLIDRRDIRNTFDEWLDLTDCTTIDKAISLTLNTAAALERAGVRWESAYISWSIYNPDECDCEQWQDKPACLIRRKQA